MPDAALILPLYCDFHAAGDAGCYFRRHFSLSFHCRLARRQFFEGFRR